ncbi:MAG: MlaD family protein [Armatimonadetes bacterium]|nr:MlaD family protein [Armatimonadota bacterium]
MRIRSEAKVGMIVFVGILALIVVYWFLGGLSLRASTYPLHAVFDNAQKLQRGADVRMAGVKIGVVRDTKLTERVKARVEMLIENGCMIPADSVARITTGAFLGEYYVEIVPGRSRKVIRPGNKLASASSTTPDELIEGASEILRSLKGSVKGINAIMADNKLSMKIHRALDALNRAVESAAELAEASSALVKQVAPDVAATISNAKKASQSAANVGTNVERLVRDDLRPKLNSLLAGINKLAEDLDKAAQESQELIEAYRSGGPALEKALTKAEKTIETIEAAADQAREMLTKLNEASTSIKELATDEQIKADLKKTIHNVSEVSGQLKETVRLVTNKLAPGAGPSPEAKQKVPEYGLTFNALANTSAGQSRFDAYYTFIHGKEFYRVGGYNIGENSQLIGQGGYPIGSGGAFRYGIYASRVGIGYDQRIGKTGLLSIDLFRPNDPQMEVRTTAKVGDWLGVYLGTNNFLKSENRNLLIGIQYRK